MSDHEVFDQKEFWPAFKHDVDNARFRILIECPFLGNWRLKDLEGPLKRALVRGVIVCVFIQKKSNRIDFDPTGDREKERQRLIETLLAWRVHVNFHDDIHSKVAIIDDNKLWDGSLNILAHNNKAGERMNRYIDSSKVKAAIRKQNLWNCKNCEQNVSRYAISDERQLGRIFRLERKHQKKSQVEIANGCGFNRTAVSKSEHGMTGTLKNMLAISSELDTRVMVIPEHLVNYIGSVLEKATRDTDSAPKATSIQMMKPGARVESSARADDGSGSRV